MPYPHRDPGVNPQTDLAFRLQPGGYFHATHLQGRPATSAESQARHRRGESSGEPGVMRPVWEQVRNGLPDHKPYVHTPEDPADTETARQAWQRVAEVQARLWGEPAPAPVDEPWNLPLCVGCGHRMRCSCGGA